MSGCRVLKRIIKKVENDKILFRYICKKDIVDESKCEESKIYCAKLNNKIVSEFGSVSNYLQLYYILSENNTKFLYKYDRKINYIYQYVCNLLSDSIIIDKDQYDHLDKIINSVISFKKEYISIE